MKFFAIMIIALLMAAPVHAQMTTADATDDSTVAQTFNDMNKGFRSLRGQVGSLQKKVGAINTDIFRAIEEGAVQAMDRQALTEAGGDTTTMLYLLYRQNRNTPDMKKAAVTRFMGQLIGGGGSDPQVEKLKSDLAELRSRLDQMATKTELQRVAAEAEEDLKKVAHAAGTAADGNLGKQARQQAIQWLANR